MSTTDLTVIQAQQEPAPRPQRFDEAVRAHIHSELHGLDIQTIQVNICLRCNLACRHCHVESSPKRREEMDWETMEHVLDAARRAGAKTLDVTGGAPEMHPRFKDFIIAAIDSGLHVAVRTNLTVMLLPEFRDMPRFFADNQVHLVASLPCYLESNVDKQRGRHVYQDSIKVIKELNTLGYGNPDALQLDLVFNPGGPGLPPAQADLEQAYRKELSERLGICFTRLYTITNMAIGRFLRDLERAGRIEEYCQLLRDSFNPCTIDGLMCRHQLHVGWDGTVYDCDFNFALGLPTRVPSPHIKNFEPTAFARRRIATGEHCFGCTAGAGSSCTGALA